MLLSRASILLSILPRNRAQKAARSYFPILSNRSTSSSISTSLRSQPTTANAVILSGTFFEPTESGMTTEFLPPLRRSLKAEHARAKSLVVVSAATEGEVARGVRSVSDGDWSRAGLRGRRFISSKLRLKEGVDGVEERWDGVAAPERGGERGREAALNPSQSERTPTKEKSRP